MSNKSPARRKTDSDIPDVLRDFLAQNRSTAMFIWTGLTIADVSEGAARLFGYDDKQELIGKSVEDIMTPGSIVVVHERFARAVAGDLPGESQVYECVRKNGEVFQIEACGLWWANDHSIALVLAHDVTGRERNAEELRKSEGLYRAIAETMPVGLMIADRTGKNIYINQPMTRIIGYSLEELMSGVWFTHPDDHHARQLYESALTEGTSRSGYETRLVKKDGTVIWASISWQPFSDGTGALQGINTVFLDITQQKTAEQALRQAHADLESAYESQQGFFNSVAHEVRTPLTAVQGYAAMLLEGVAGPLNEEQAAMLHKAVDGADHLLHMVDGILEAARLKSGMMTVHPRLSDLTDIVHKAVVEVQPQATQKGLKVEIKRARRDIAGAYDEEKTTAILTNLLSNAVKFTDQGTIDVIVRSRAAGAQIIIADSGIGIDESDLNVIFDEFRQLDKPRRYKPPGFGMGLAIVATMVDAVGAALTVSSSTGIGTAFTIDLPALQP